MDELLSGRITLFASEHHASFQEQALHSRAQFRSVKIHALASVEL
jgi:hypothetical protein